VASVIVRRFALALLWAPALACAMEAAPPEAALIAPPAAAAPAAGPVPAANVEALPAAAERTDPPSSPPPTAMERLKEVQRGIASWYGHRFHGRKTASGEVYDMDALTAAHPTLPFGTVVRVQSLVNGKTVDVRINDRGPHIRKRIIDLSRGAAKALGLIDAGTGTKPVALSIVRP
jgi:rare lipoprotein A